MKYLVIPSKRVRRKAESVPNIFLLLKQEFSDQLVARKENVVRGGSSKAGGSASAASDESKPMSKAMMEFRKEWGVQWVMKIFEAYSHLQRMASILGWTLEINHFFVSMFGNTLTFSKLPLRDILMTQKNVMTNFLCITNDLYKFACTVNSDQVLSLTPASILDRHTITTTTISINILITTITPLRTTSGTKTCRCQRMSWVE